jgi:glycosyltransferase involved in cell wall biosynthesis
VRDVFLSTIIPTVGRPTLARAVESVLAQTLDKAEFEVIVINDSGKPLPEAAWQQAGRVRIANTNRRERAVARNVGAAMARGRYLHFLDDDDWLAPDAFTHFWWDRPETPVGWLYGVSQLVDRQDRPVIQLHHGLTGNCSLQVMAGEWIPLQSSLISADAFFAVGGFDPRLAGPEDIDLLRRIALGYEIAKTAGLIAFIEMGEAGSTTDYGRHASLRQRARESILDQPAVFDRLRSSASDSFWHGRLARVYLTSIVWNARRLRPLTALSRAGYAWRALWLRPENLFAPNFWRSMFGPYASPTFRRGFAVATGE